jgi:hypothetical protein
MIGCLIMSSLRDFGSWGGKDPAVYTAGYTHLAPAGLMDEGKRPNLADCHVTITDCHV